MIGLIAGRNAACEVRPAIDMVVPSPPAGWDPGRDLKGRAMVPFAGASPGHTLGTRDDLNRAERANIAAGLRWARRGRFDVLDPGSLLALHRAMFGDVWRWAGKPRDSEKNIGVADWWKVREYLQVLTGDVTAQVEAGTRPPDEIAVDFHYRMVSIHVFANGNGRHARLSPDLLAGRLGREVFTWSRAALTDPGETRAVYVAALKAADGFDLEPLVAFARA